MSLRDTINNNSATVTIVAVVALCLALALIVWNNMGGRSYQVPNAYFVDLNTNEIFEASGESVPAIQAPSDEGDSRSGVAAYIYSCTECPPNLAGQNIDEIGDSDDLFLAYLERYTEEARAILSGEASEAEMDRYYEGGDRGRFIRAPGSSRWISETAPNAGQLMFSPQARCGRDAKICRPES